MSDWLDSWSKAIRELKFGELMVESKESSVSEPSEMAMNAAKSIGDRFGDPYYSDEVAARFIDRELAKAGVLIPRETLDLQRAAAKLCMWVRHTVPEWTPEVDEYLEATEAALRNLSEGK